MAEIDPRTKAVNTAVRDAAIRIVDVALGQGAIIPEHALRLERDIYKDVTALWRRLEVMSGETRQGKSLGYDWIEDVTNDGEPRQATFNYDTGEIR